MSKQYQYKPEYWLAFNQIATIGPVRLQRLLKYFPDLQAAWQAPFNELIKAGLEQKAAEQIIIQRPKINPKQELEKIQEKNIKIVTIFDKQYPKLLKEIYAPPPLLYYLGDFDINQDFLLAVVGTRKMSAYGEQITQQLVSELTRCGLNIVSGLALGIDACAHQAALANRGKTTAVLGSGLDQIYPATNRRLSQKIIENHGLIISEFPLGTIPFKSNFPQRNRIISGLSLGTLIIEAGIKSGALITAKYALEQNREVFAVPGNINHTLAAGPNQLIKMGAKMVTQASDILETLNLEQAQIFQTTQKIIPATETEKTLFKFLSDEPLHVDKLANLARLNISVTNATWTIMEMKGLIKNLGQQNYVKK
jgi:DNA processing protein